MTAGVLFYLDLIVNVSQFPKHLSELYCKQGNGRGNGQRIRHRLSQEDCKYLVFEEVRQYKDQRDQQDNLTKNRQEQRSLGISHGKESLLAGNLRTKDQ